LLYFEGQDIIFFWRR